jgi:hypothetical protein
VEVVSENEIEFSETEVFDAEGHLIYVKKEDGYITTTTREQLLKKIASYEKLLADAKEELRLLDGGQT